MHEENKIYCTADEKYLKAIVLYGHSDNKLYFDVEHKQPVTKEEFSTIVNNSIIVEYLGTSYRPNSIKKSTDYEVTILTTSGSVTAVVLKTQK